VANIAMGMGRAMRAMMAFQQIKADYEMAYKGLDDLAYNELIAHPKVKEVHLRGAQKALEICRANRGADSASIAKGNGLRNMNDGLQNMRTPVCVP
jgi:hypothetical protein